MRRAVLVTALLLAGPAEAQVAVDVALNSDGDAFATQLGITPAELAGQMQGLLNGVYGATDVDAYIRSFADSTAFSMRGLGVDYASDPSSILLGLGANVAVAAPETVNATERPTSGLTANVALMTGYNLSSHGAPRWTLYGNGFYRTGSTTSLRGGILSAGLHVQYRLVDPQRDDRATTKALRWTGIDVTGGLEITRWSLGIKDDIVTEMGIDGANGKGRVILDSTGTFNIRSTAGSIPLEISTGIRIAMLVSVYVGTGVDVTVGQGSLAVDLGGPLYAGDGTVIGSSTITGGGERSASPFAARVLAGAQLNLSKFRIYAQVNGSAIPAANVGFGIRAVL